MPTTKLGLPTIAGNANADVVRDMNALANAVDDKAGVAEGLATLDATGKVPSTQVTAVPNASTSVAGKVMLSNSVISVSEGLAATPKAVKAAYDLATEAKTQANDQKTKWAAVVGSPLLASDTSTVLQSKTQTIKNDLATNLTAKGQASAGNETLDALIDKVALVNTGKKWASGTVMSSSESIIFINMYGNNDVRPYVNVPLNLVNFEVSHVEIFSTNKAVGDGRVTSYRKDNYYLNGSNYANTRLDAESFKVTPYANGVIALPAALLNNQFTWIAYE